MVKYIVEQPLSQFEFWSGAKDRAEKLTIQELDRIGEEFEILYSDGELTDVKINDLFWFDFDWVCSLIGLTEEEVDERGKDET